MGGLDYRQKEAMGDYALGQKAEQAISSDSVAANRRMICDKLDSDNTRELECPFPMTPEPT